MRIRKVSPQKLQNDTSLPYIKHGRVIDFICLIEIEEMGRGINLLLKSQILYDMQEITNN